MVLGESVLRKILIASMLGGSLVACEGVNDALSPSLPSSETPIIIDVNNEKKIAGIALGLSGMGSDVAPKSFSRRWLSLPNRLMAQIQQYESVVGRDLRVLQPFSELCTVNGTRTLVLNDINNNGLADFGESVSVNFNQCNDGGGSVTNGSMSLISGACTLKFTGGTCKALDITLDIKVSDVNGSGSVQGDMSSVSHNFSQESQIDVFNTSFETKSESVLNSSYLSFSFGGESIIFHDLTSIQQSDSSGSYDTGAITKTRSDETHFSVDVDVAGFSGQLTVNNWVPMHWFGLGFDSFSNYLSGSLRVTGGNGTIIGLDASTGDLNTVQLTTNGGAPQLVTWAELEKQSPVPSFF